MEEIDEFEDIRTKYQKKNGIKKNYLSTLPLINQEEKQSKLSANKSPLNVVKNNFDLDARYLSENVDHDEDSFNKIFELHEKQVSGFLPSANINKISSNFSSFLFSLDKSYNINNRFIDNIYYKCKCLLPFHIPVTDKLICAWVVPYRDDIIFS